MNNEIVSTFTDIMLISFLCIVSKGNQFCVKLLIKCTRMRGMCELILCRQI